MEGSRLRGLLPLVFLWWALYPGEAYPQQDSFAKNFSLFPNIAPGVDFFARKQADLVPFEKPIRKAQQRLSSLLVGNLAKGAIVICSSLEQKDAVNESRILKRGYAWVLVELTPEVASEQMVAQIKSQMGGQLPPGLLERLQNQPPEMKAAAQARLATNTAQKYGYAVLATTLMPDKEFRSSRLEDMGRSPLADWLDIGLSAYAAGNTSANLRFLQDHLEEVFPLEDIMGMSRPFVVPSESGPGSTSGGGMVVRFAGPGPSTGSAPPAPGAGDRPVSRPVSMPKDVQDRLMFDAQSASFFSYIAQKVGIDKARELVQWNREGKNSSEFFTRADVLGADFEKIEKDWQEWVKLQKAPAPGIRLQTGPATKAPEE